MLNVNQIGTDALERLGKGTRNESVAEGSQKAIGGSYLFMPGRPDFYTSLIAALLAISPGAAPVKNRHGVATPLQLVEQPLGIKFSTTNVLGRILVDQM